MPNAKARLQVDREVLHRRAEVDVRLAPVENLCQLFAKLLLLRDAFLLRPDRRGSRSSNGSSPLRGVILQELTIRLGLRPRSAVPRQTGLERKRHEPGLPGLACE